MWMVHNSQWASQKGCRADLQLHAPDTALLLEPLPGSVCCLQQCFVCTLLDRYIYIWGRAGVQPESELASGPNRKVLPFAESVSVQEFIDCQSGSILRVGR